jgi:hypothetical protein
MGNFTPRLEKPQKPRAFWPNANIAALFTQLAQKAFHMVLGYVQCIKVPYAVMAGVVDETRSQEHHLKSLCH